MSDGPQGLGSTEPGIKVLYVIESDSGLLVTNSQAHGNHLPYWHDRKVAEEMCKRYDGPLPHRVSEMGILEFYGQLLAVRKGGMAYVLMDKVPDGSARIVPIDEAIHVYGKILSNSTPYRHSSMDEFVRLLDRMRRFGVPVEAKDEYLPIDCPNCGQFISVHECAYRQWRDELDEMVCPHCMSFFSEATSGRVRCSTCENESGFMPLSLCRSYSEAGSRWRCQQCHDREAKEELQLRINENRESAKPRASGCLIFVALSVGVTSWIAWIV